MESAEPRTSAAEDEAAARAEIQRIVARMRELDERIRADQTEIERLKLETAEIQRETRGILATLRSA